MLPLCRAGRWRLLAAADCRCGLRCLCWGLLRTAQHALSHTPPPSFGSVSPSLPPISPPAPLPCCCPAALLPAAALPLACGLCWRDWSELSHERPGAHHPVQIGGLSPSWGATPLFCLCRRCALLPLFLLLPPLPSACYAPSLPPSLPSVRMPCLPPYACVCLAFPPSRPHSQPASHTHHVFVRK